MWRSHAVRKSLKSCIKSEQVSRRKKEQLHRRERHDMAVTKPLNKKAVDSRSCIASDRMTEQASDLAHMYKYNQHKSLVYYLMVFL